MYIAAISSGPGHSLHSRRLLRLALIMVPQGLYESEVIKGRWFEAATSACAWDCAFPPISCIPSFVRRSVLFGKLGRVLLLLLPPPGGNRGANSQAIPARPSGAAPKGLGTSRFTKALEMKKRRSARCPRVAALVQLHPAKTTAPASWRLTLPWVSPGAGWWVTGATGRANCAC
jgi:hypothetical protein